MVNIVGLSGIPEFDGELKKLIASADGLLMVNPENNNSIPGVFKHDLRRLPHE